MGDLVTRAELENAKDSLRRETQAALTTVSVQVGAVEKLLGARLDGLKWRLIAALVGGQVVAGAVASMVATRDPETPVKTAVAVARAVGIL